MNLQSTEKMCRPVLQHADGDLDDDRSGLKPLLGTYSHADGCASSMSKSSALQRFQEALATWPQTGTGDRLVHRHVARLARLSQLAGIPAAQAAAAIDEAMRRYTRPPQAGEIAEALRFVGGGEVADLSGGEQAKVVQPVAFDTFRAYAEAGVATGFCEADLRNPSLARMPGSEGALRITWEPGWQDSILFLLALFEAEDWVLCLPRNDVRAGEGDVRRRDEWCAELQRRGQANEALPVFVCPNPIKSPGQWALNQSREPSPRVKDSVAMWRNLVLDRDLNPLHNRDLAVATQVAFWGGWGQRFGWSRIRAVVHTGNKSLHTILAIDIPGTEEWGEVIARGTISEFVRMGFDKSFSNPAQLCRLPGAWRRLEDHQLEPGDQAADGTVPEANRWKQQRLLYVGGVR